MSAAEAIAVGIPAYRDGPHLARLLDRLEATGAALEIIVVDDCSEDGTAETAARRAPPPGGALRVLRNPRNLGPGPSRNRAIEVAQAEFLLFIDADDLPHRDLFAWLSDAPPRGGVDFTLFRHHLCTAEDALFPYRMIPRDETAWRRARVQAGGLSGPVRPCDAPALMGTIAFPWNRLLNVDFLRREEVRFPDLRLHEDVPFHWRCFLRAQRICALDHAPPLLHHFQLAAGGRATDADDARRLDAFRALEMVMEEEPALGEPVAAEEFIGFAADLALWAGGLLAEGPHAAAMAARAAALDAGLERLAAAAGIDWQEERRRLATLCEGLGETQA